MASLVTAALVSVLLAGVASAHGRGDERRLLTYRVKLTNLTHGQPFSPPVAATHNGGVHEFRMGRLATDQLAAIAQDGDPGPMSALLSGSPHVTRAVNVGRPLTPAGSVAGGFSDSVTFTIQAREGDRFSIATMLICTNDGFTGLDSVKLPDEGHATYWLNAYDAGREQNTERSVDIVDPCSALGPVTLAGDPNGNRDAAVATVPAQVIQPHPGIHGGGDLSPSLHDWTDPVAKVTITLVSDNDD